MRCCTLAGVGIAFLAFGLVGTAAAESLVSISYTVTGGTFTGPNFSGPITGGSLTYTPPGGSVETPSMCGTDTATSCGSAQLTLIGSAGTFTGMLSPFLTTQITASYFSGSGTAGSGYSGSAPASMGFWLFVYDGSAIMYGSVSGTISSGYSNLFYHYFTLGQEVRTVPEPSPGMAQLGVGIGLLGILGAHTGMAAIRARRRGRR
jgi:hypothetical protein